ncbi:helix-turn-helix transcriptional regulator [Enorma phocaeensis]|uniref:helix-turn-helix transcriptional regulator n=1 Tax=Enorma phocaeensis TaxID=1871019 RepID=UPI0015E0AF12|nr:WYL domain-containing protein [Enorma phocaeensis]
MARGESIAHDATAGRLLNLLFIFNATTRPLTTDEIVSDSDLGYGSPQRDSDLRKFRRDRIKLAEQGIFIEEVKNPGDAMNTEGSWRLNRNLTFASAGSLDAEDAQTLADAINGYLGNIPSPLTRPLRSVEEKAFEVAADRHRPLKELASTADSASNPLLDAVWIAFALRRRLTFTYINAQGDASKRTVSIYGIFSRDGVFYFSGHDNLTNTVRTFRIDRVERAWKPSGSYTIPQNFDVRDQLFFAFDLAAGEGSDVTFSLPASITEDELEALTLGRGSIDRVGADNDDQWAWHWTVKVKDVSKAASFGLVHARDGMRPIAPQQLIDEWNALIERTVTAHVPR